MSRLSAVLGLVVSTGALALPTNKFYWPTPDSNVRVCSYRDDGNVKDWKCGGNTYAGHTGTDIAVVSGTTVLASAAGVVEQRIDGCPVGYVGSTCGFNGGNQIVLWHGDSTASYYGHLLAGSGLSAMGASVGCGDRVGGSGASGSATGPHLHWEPKVGATQGSPYSGVADDPYSGPCSGPLSYWASQGTGYSSSCGVTAVHPQSASTCGCPPGVYPLFNCVTGQNARERCVNGKVETQQCPYGCQINALGVEDTCKPAPACPANTFPLWTCLGDLTARERCINGKVEKEACTYGCQDNAQGSDDTCKPAPPPPTCEGDVKATWSCAADAFNRRRCVNGQVETQACEHGCVLLATGEAICRAAPSCPAGTSASWACDATGGRTRCTGGKVETQACSNGCEVGASGEALCKEGPNPPPACPAGTYPRFTCEADGSALVRCEGGVTTRTPCASGCTPSAPEADDVCAAAPVTGEPTPARGCGCGAVDASFFGFAVLGMLGFGLRRPLSRRRR